jgi:hypothetical protein
MKLKNYFVLCLLLLGLTGCISLKLDEAAKQIGELSWASLIYQGHNDSWPNSIDELKSFCSQNQEECPSLDWNKYTNAKFETLPDESLRLEFYISEEQNESLNSQKPNVVVTLSKPEIQKNNSKIDTSDKDDSTILRSDL